jgi:hypothetical protein
MTESKFYGTANLNRSGTYGQRSPTPRGLYSRAITSLRHSASFDVLIRLRRRDPAPAFNGTLPFRKSKPSSLKLGLNMVLLGFDGGLDNPILPKKHRKINGS